MQCVCFAASSTAAKLLAMAMATCTHNLTESELQNTHSFVRGAHESLQESLHMKACTCMEASKHEKRAESAWKCAESARCVESLSTDWNAMLQKRVHEATLAVNAIAKATKMKIAKVNTAKAK